MRRGEGRIKKGFKRKGDYARIFHFHYFVNIKDNPG